MLGFAIVAAVDLAAANELAVPRGSELTFERDVRPILKANCFECHGEGEKLKSGLDLRLRRLMVAGGKSGPAIVPGDPENSPLVELIRKGDMPKRDKKLSPADIATVEKWIATGAKTARPEPADLPSGMTITDEERAHWAYQPIRRPDVPKFKTKDRVRTPVDAFLLAAMSPKGLSFSRDVDKVTLLRRAHLDLIGLPPAPDDMARFLADDSTDAYERALDRLLASPQYGERWGRHWLDAAGYADSEGATDADTPREYAWKFRDYVIKSFNADKPFDQFIIEQLAGDELAGASQANAQSAVHDPKSLECLVATGFLRMGPDGTASSPDQDAARNAVVADALKIVSTSLLGLSVGCAQCHDHRYDPIPQTDYYRLRAVFEPAFDSKHWRTPPQRLISLYTEADRAKAAEVAVEVKKLSDEKLARQNAAVTAVFEKELLKFEPVQREKLRDAFNAPKEKRTDEQKKLLDENPSVKVEAGILYQYDPKAKEALAEALKPLDAKISELRAKCRPEDFVSVLTEVPGQIPVTYLFHRGDPQQPKEAIKPGGLTVLESADRRLDFPEKDSSLSTSGRRLAFARWLVSTNNPLTKRLIVNRVWLHHFGRGLVETPADFGAMGEKPTHPQLLDWLASEFAAQGWSLKKLHKLIMTSTAYRQSSSRAARGAVAADRASGSSKAQKLVNARRINVETSHAAHLPNPDAIDPENRFYWRKPLQRLDAEAIRDSIMAVSGTLNLKPFGPPVPVRRDLVGQIVVGIDQTKGDNQVPVEVPLNGEEYRRSIYIQVRRSRPLAMLNTFDEPVMEVNCEMRQCSTVAPQALMLMNSQFILDQASKLADRLRKEAGPEPRQQISRGWQVAFSRAPTEQEVTLALAFFGRQLDYLRDAEAKQTTPLPNEKDAKAPEKVESEVQVLRDFSQALLSANEFLYVN